MKRLFDSVPAAIAWRYSAHAAMVALAIWNESRPAAPIHDAVLAAVPRIGWIADHNYHFWILCYVPVALALWREDRKAFLHFLWLGGVLSLVRGICIPLVPLGPPEGPDVNAGIDAAAMWKSWVAIVNPLTALFTNAPHAGLTKDMFFSGHVSSTFLLWLYCRGRGALGPIAMAGHLLVTASVFLAHLHYTVDVIGAWAITGALYALAVRRWPVSRPATIARAAGTTPA